MKLNIPIQFTGVVTVDVPDHLPNTDAKLLAERVALARILATTNNEDGPEDDAFDAYATTCSTQSTAEQDWDQSKTISVSGKWTAGENDDD